jgi:hypothetical protein
MDFTDVHQARSTTPRPACCTSGHRLRRYAVPLARCAARTRPCPCGIGNPYSDPPQQVGQSRFGKALQQYA